MTRVLYDPKPEYQLDGTQFAGTSCTCVGVCVCTDRNTHGATRLDWHDVRAATHDTVGGTNWDQVDKAAASIAGFDDLSTGWWTEDQVDHLIATEGKGFGAAIIYTAVHRFGLEQIKNGVAQDELVTGQERGFTGPDSWHAVVFHEWLQPGESKTFTWQEHARQLTKTLRAPANERLMVVYDSLCDGRRPTVAHGPVGYPESLWREVVADSLMANGKLYGSVTLDARYEVDNPPDPHHTPRRTLKFGGQPAHKRLRTAKPAFLRSSPRRSKADPKRNRVRWVPRRFRFTAYQRTDHGTEIAGSRTWCGNRAGDLWIHDSRLEAHA